MRSAILCWSLGFFAIGGLAGCSSLHNDRCDSCATTPKQVAQKKDDATNQAKTKVSPNVVILNGYRGPVESTPIAAEGRPARVEPLPQVVAAPVPAAEKKLGPIKLDVMPPPPVKDPSASRSTTAIVTKDDEISATPIRPLEDVVLLNQTVVGKSAPIENGTTEKSQSLTGMVEVFRKTWRLRYAAIDQEDEYGGVVVLDCGAELNMLRDGVRVRVRGTLIPPTERNGSAHYRVEAIQILD